jgi:hypothetical protein
MLAERGLEGWEVRGAHEEDDISGRYGHCFFEEKLIWVNMRYAGGKSLVYEILRHEIAHALSGKASHGPAFRAALERLKGDEQ